MQTTTIHWRQKAASVRGIDQAFIDGEYVTPQSHEGIERISPVDGRKLGAIAGCSPGDVDRAVRAARRAFDDGRWCDLQSAQRKRVLCRFAELIAQHAEELALLDTLSMGKPVANGLHNDIPLAVECLRWFAEAGDKVYDQCVPPQTNVVGTITREPLGVVGAITPWNYPMVNVAWKIAPALTAGNSLVLKPAEQASFSAIYLGQLAIEAGIPAGVFNVVPGRGEIAGRALALHGDVDGVYFTGSTQTGKNILQYAGQSNLKHVALECGGKSAFIVLKQCTDLKRAAAVLARNIFYNQGQTCTAPSRLIVERSVHDALIEHLLSIVHEYAPGDPLHEKTTIGAMVSHEHLQNVMEYVRLGEEQGARLIFGGRETSPVKGGAYMMPTIFDQVKNEMRIAQEEIFGPVLAVISVGDAREAIQTANDSAYGLAAAVFCDEINLAFQVARRIRAGLVHINSYGEDNITAPFGGYKQSGNGTKDKAVHALHDYMAVKTTWLGLQPI